jgi:hypothetical protein
VLANFSFADLGAPGGTPPATGTSGAGCAALGFSYNPACTTPGLAAALTATCAGRAACTPYVASPLYQPVNESAGNASCAASLYVYYTFTCVQPAMSTSTPTRSPSQAVMGGSSGFETTAGGFTAYAVCPQSATVSNITFASYGQPHGSPSDTTTWSANSYCASPVALSRIAARCLGLNGCGFNTIDDELGMPTGG